MAELAAARYARLSDALVRAIDAGESGEAVERRMWKTCFEGPVAAARACRGASPRGNRKARRILGRVARAYEALLARVADRAGGGDAAYRCLLRLGDARRYAGDGARAAAYYERAAAVAPDRGEALNALGALAQRESRLVAAAARYAAAAEAPRPFAAAERNLAAALRLLAKRPPAHAGLAAAVLLLGRAAAGEVPTAAHADLRRRLGKPARAECDALFAHLRPP